MRYGGRVVPLRHRQLEPAGMQEVGPDRPLRTDGSRHVGKKARVGPQLDSASIRELDLHQTLRPRLDDVALAQLHPGDRNVSVEAGGERALAFDERHHWCGVVCRGSNRERKQEQ